MIKMVQSTKLICRIAVVSSFLALFVSHVPGAVASLPVTDVSQRTGGFRQNSELLPLGTLDEFSEKLIATSDQLDVDEKLAATSEQLDVMSVGYIDKALALSKKLKGRLKQLEEAANLAGLLPIMHKALALSKKIKKSLKQLEAANLTGLLCILHKLKGIGGFRQNSELLPMGTLDEFSEKLIATSDQLDVGEKLAATSEQLDVMSVGYIDKALALSKEITKSLKQLEEAANLTGVPSVDPDRLIQLTTAFDRTEEISKNLEKVLTIIALDGGDTYMETLRDLFGKLQENAGSLGQSLQSINIGQLNELHNTRARISTLVGGLAGVKHEESVLGEDGLEEIYLFPNETTLLPLFFNSTLLPLLPNITLLPLFPNVTLPDPLPLLPNITLLDTLLPLLPNESFPLFPNATTNPLFPIISLLPNRLFPKMTSVPLFSNIKLPLLGNVIIPEGTKSLDVLHAPLESVINSTSYSIGVEPSKSTVFPSIVNVSWANLSKLFSPVSQGLRFGSFVSSLQSAEMGHGGGFLSPT